MHQPGGPATRAPAAPERAAASGAAPAAGRRRWSPPSSEPGGPAGKGAEGDFWKDIMDFFDDFKGEKPEMIAELGKELGISSEHAMDLAIAMAELKREADAAEDRVKALGKSAKDDASEFKKAQLRLAELRIELGKLSEGGFAGQEEFKDVTKEVTKWRNRLAENLGLSQQEIQVLNEMEEVMTKISALETAIAEKKKQDVFAERTREEIAAMVKLTEATKQGSIALEFYNDVTKQVETLRARMEELKFSQEEITQATTAYRETLIQLKDAQDNFSNAAKAAAQATVNSLENVIFATQSVGDAMRQLAQDIARVILRAAILDPLVRSLTGGFTSMFGFGGSGNIAQAGPGGLGLQTGGASLGSGMTFGRGGSFTVGGAGSVDSKLVAFKATPGETVTIDRESHGRESGGGSVNITINAPGADAGTFARIREMVEVEMVPQIIRNSTRNTSASLQRPRFA